MWHGIQWNSFEEVDFFHVNLRFCTYVGFFCMWHLIKWTPFEKVGFSHHQLAFLHICWFFVYDIQFGETHWSCWLFSCQLGFLHLCWFFMCDIQFDEIYLKRLTSFVSTCLLAPMLNFFYVYHLIRWNSFKKGDFSYVNLPSCTYANFCVRESISWIPLWEDVLFDHKPCHTLHPFTS